MSDSLITKKALAASLKELCHTKSFDKISIADITEHCGLNRQSFYYHFQDKYDLLNWIYYNEAFINIPNGITFDNWDERLFSLLQTILKDKIFYTNTLKTTLETFTDYLFNITHTLFLEAAEILDTKNELSKESKNFFAQFNAYGICGVFNSWVKSGMKVQPEQISSNLKSLVANSKQLAFDRFEENKSN